ncbi:MAG: LysE family translocator [Anaerolineae bacterium]|nr:LysE family translocator [Anaerolineae bacterium]
MPVPDLPTLTIFLAATMLLLITPGPAVLYIITRSIDQGRTAGVVSALGVGTGTMFHVAGASLGLSAILVSSALAYSVVKYLGAAYLIYLGIRKFLEKSELEQPTLNGHKSLSRIFRQGVVVNILNPKTALFFFAFLPQFVDPARGTVALQVLFLGLLFVGLGIFSDSAYALVAGTAGHWLKNSAAFLRGQRYFAGTIYVALGLTTALSGSHGKS